MGRAIGGAVVGYALWSVLWVGGSAAVTSFVPELGEPGTAITSVPLLLGFLVWSVVLSVSSGFVTAKIAQEKSVVAVRGVAAALLLTGIGVQVGSWSLMPVWYHIIFLALLVPMTVAGGRLAD